MLDLLIHSQPVFRAIIREIGFPAQYDLSLEYTVGPFDGLGKASHTDVMLTAGGASLAIEAKWTEPMYSAVRNWPERGAIRTTNQDLVLNGWLKKLGQEYSPQFDDVIYQMLHRAASAAVAGQSPRLAYFAFASKEALAPKSAKPDALFQQLAKLWSLLGTDAFQFYLVEIKIEPLSAFDALPKTKGPATDEVVRAALQGTNPLFAFRQATIRETGTQVDRTPLYFQTASSTTEAL